MVKRWHPLHKYMVDTEDLYHEAQGEYVAYSDYLSLREALRTALDGWAIADHMGLDKQFIDPLRKQFLGD